MHFSTHSQITELKKRMPAAAIAEMHRELNRQAQDYDLTVLPVEDATDQAFKKRWSATLNVVETVPTTLAGVRAKIEFATSADFVFEALVDNEGRVHAFLDTLVSIGRRHCGVASTVAHLVERRR